MTLHNDVWPSVVIAGLDPAIHAFPLRRSLPDEAMTFKRLGEVEAWMTGTSPAMTALGYRTGGL